MRNKEESKKMANFILAFMGGFIQKISSGVVSNAKQQVDEVILKIEKGVMAGMFIFFGMIFVLIGITVTLNTFFEFVPGAGYYIVGLSSLLVALLIVALKK